MRKTVEELLTEDDVLQLEEVPQLLAKVVGRKEERWKCPGKDTAIIKVLQEKGRCQLLSQ